MSRNRRMTEAEKRRRRYARQDGKYVVVAIARAIRYQQDALWFAARPQYADNAKIWQGLSDQAVESAVQNARYAAHWAAMSQEAF